jgi:endonuclease YncB( thermonuclease family)
MTTDTSDIPNDAPMFSDCVNGTTVTARVVSVYDGDTIKVVFPLNDIFYKWNCRLMGVDTPEVRTRNTLEKEHGYFVRDRLKEKINDKIVSLKCEDLDKYGRLLITVMCENDNKVMDCNVNQWLIDSDYAFAYDGGTKRSWGDYLQNIKQD